MTRFIWKRRCALGRRMAGAPGSTADRIRYGFELCLARPPATAELKRLLSFHETALSHYEQKPALAREMAASGAEPPPPGAKDWPRPRGLGGDR